MVIIFEPLKVENAFPHIPVPYPIHVGLYPPGGVIDPGAARTVDAFIEGGIFAAVKETPMAET